ncbi:MAG: class I adenylate-forming enzyme family protein [Actinomycetota bacterium]
MLSPTFHSPRAAAYRAPGGAWDRPSLDALLTVAASDDTNARVADVAGGLRAAGIQPGAVVTWQSPNRVEVTIAYRACWRAGVVASPIHHQAGPAEAVTMREQLRPDLTLDLDALPHGAPVTRPWEEREQLAAVLWTSGSSGAPKGALHTQATLAYKAATMASAHALGPEDCVLMPAPCAHISGLLNGVTLPGVVPFRTVFMARWDPAHALDLIESERVTFMVGPPTFFVSLMGAPGFSPARVTSLRLISSGGAGVSTAFVEQATRALGARVKRTYGSTEAPTIVTEGQPIGEVELSIGDDGELLVRGPEVCVGYLDGTHTRDAFTTDGWFRTGDLATLDPVTIVGRVTDVIIRGGENVSTAEVAAALEAHPAVRHAVAVGYPDPLMGERVGAVVVVDDTFDVERARAWFHERGIARYKCPERVLVVDALPLLATGKPDQRALRALLTPR